MNRRMFFCRSLAAVVLAATPTIQLVRPKPKPLVLGVHPDYFRHWTPWEASVEFERALQAFRTFRDGKGERILQRSP